MRLLRYVFSVFLPVCLLGCQQSSDPAYFDPLVHTWPHDMSDITPDPDIRYGVLDNGLRYALYANQRPEGEAALRFWIKGGGKHEAEELQGVAHYLEHMAFNGSENVPEGEMVKSLERLGLSFGADTNAFTNLQQTQYTLNLPEVDDETVDYALFLMRETADRLLIEPDAVDRERGVVKAEEARGNTPGRAAARARSEFFYPDALLTKRTVIGSPESLDAIDADDLRTFYKTYYRPERAMIAMVGDFDLDRMETKITDVFSTWQNETPTVPEPDTGLITDRSGAIKVYEDDELSTRMSLLGFDDTVSTIDTLEARRRSFVRGKAIGIVNQRMRKKALAPDAPLRGAGISASSSDLGTALNAGINPKDDDWATALAFVEQEIRRAVQYGFQQAEYDELIARERRSLTDSVNNASKRRSGSLASSIVGTFTSGSVRTTPQSQLDRFESNVASVTLKELEDYFANTWDNYDPAIWLQGPDVGDVTEDDIRSVFAASRSTPVDPPAEKKAKTFAYQTFGTPGTIVSTRKIEDFDIEQIIFENNVRLNLKKTDFEDKWMRVAVNVGEGFSRFKKEDAALLTLAGSFSMGGFEAHPINEINEIFAGKKVSVGMRTNSGHLGFSGGTNQDDLHDQLRAWTAMLTAPGYRPEWKQKFMEGIDASFHTIDSTPGGVAARDLGRIWRSGDPRYGFLAKEAYKAATIEGVRRIVEPSLKTGAIEIGIVGDFDRDAVIEAVASTYGALPTRKAEFDINEEAYDVTFPPSGRVELTHTGADNQGAIYMAWPTSQDWNIDRQRAYSVIRRILQNRMIETIREDMGLTYSPSAGLNFSETYAPFGYVSASMTSDPQYFSAFEDAVLKITANLALGDITEDELERVKKPILEGFERGLKENSAWLGIVTRSQSRPEFMERRRTRNEAYTTLTADALNVYAKELFSPQSRHTVIIKPELNSND